MSQDSCCQSGAGSGRVGIWGPLGHPFVFLRLASFSFNSEGDKILPYKLANQQTKWVKLKVWRELPKINLLDLLANENHCNFSTEDNTAVVFWLKMIESLRLIGPGEKLSAFPRQGSYKLREIMIIYIFSTVFFFLQWKEGISPTYILCCHLITIFL